MTLEKAQKAADTLTPIRSELGRTNKVAYRERFKLANGQFLDVTRDSAQNGRVVEFAVRKSFRRNYCTSVW